MRLAFQPVKGLHAEHKEMTEMYHCVRVSWSQFVLSETQTLRQR